MLKQMALGFALTLTSPAFAGHAPDFTLQSKTSGTGIEIVAVPPTGHHFNVQAPMALEEAGLEPTRIKPAQASEREVVFKLKQKPSAVTVTLYLCDDQKTFCESHKVSKTFSESLNGAADVNADRPPVEEAMKSPLSAKPGAAHGFLLNQPAAAFAQARKQHKPLLVDVFGIWCPPCNLFDEEVFSTAEFKSAASRFVKLKVDADSEASWEIKSRYRVGGYPTILFLTEQGEEISRVVGFREKSLFVAEVERAWRERDQSFPVLKARADQGDQAAAAKVGLTYLERKEYEPAMTYLAQAPTLREELSEARIGFWKKRAEESKAAEPHLITALEHSLQIAPSSPESVDRRMELADLYAARKDAAREKQLLTAAAQTAQELIQHPERLAGKDSSPADLWGSIAEIRAKLGDDAAEKAAWKAAAAEYQKKAPASHERANNLELAYCLFKAGDVAGAEKIYGELEKSYPREFTFFYNHGHMEFELKKFAPARENLMKAYEYSYGDNRLRSAQLLGKVYQAEGKKAEAAELIQKTLRDAKLPKDQSVRTHRYVAQLRELLKTLN